MKKVFVSHPFKGDEEMNLAKVSKICRRLVDRGIMPISPLHALRFLRDSEHRDYAFEWCKEMIKICDEVWVYGDWRLSEGCQKEVEWASELGKLVVFE